MSKTTIPEGVKLQLWVRAGGRCQYLGCNEALWKDLTTKTSLNAAYVAHIIADSPGGPRGHTKLSHSESSKISNLMLLCDRHHRLVDREQAAEHSAQRLQDMKRIHEERIERQTEIGPELSSHVLLYSADIAQHSSPVSYTVAAAAMAPYRYPASDRPFQLAMVNSSLKDGNKNFWRVQESHLRQQFERHIRPAINHGEVKHLSVFAVAPQPLLMQLGALCGSLVPTDVYHLHREPQGWKWPGDAKAVSFVVRRPKKFDKLPALVFSLSASISNDRIHRALGSKASIWQVCISKPSSNGLRHTDQAKEFRELVRNLLNEIKTKHGHHSTLHVFPAMPAFLAVEFGRVLMPKADMPIQTYDTLVSNREFAPALKLLPVVKSIKA